MKTKEIDLQEIANEILESIEAGGDYHDEYEQGFGDFLGYSVGALRHRFESDVEDMRDYAEPEQQDWVDFFGKIDQERHSVLILQPSLATIDELRMLAASNEEGAYQCFCSAVGISLTSEGSGPVVVIGTMGDNMEPEIFLVSGSRQEAEKTWAMEWIYINWDQHKICDTAKKVLRMKNLSVW